MGQKIHPNGFRVGITRDWHATWFAGQKEYASLVTEDINIRQAIDGMYEDAGISKVDIERDSNEVAVTIHTCLLYTSPSPRDLSTSRMPSSA